jgi:hypothetical protein
MKKIHQWVSLLLLCSPFAMLGNAHAEAEMGSPVEGQLVLGKRSFALPPGQWHIVDTSGSNTKISMGGGDGGAVRNGYLVQYDAQKRFVAAMVIRATVSSTGRVASWNDTTCDTKNLLVNQALDGRMDFPACFLVYYSRNFWKDSPSTEADKRIWSWYQENKIALPTTALATSYIKYFAGDFVRVTYWLNPELAGIPADKGLGSPSAWSSELIKSNPENLNYIETVKTWGTSLIAANRASLLDGKPNMASLPVLPGLVK